MEIFIEDVGGVTVTVAAVDELDASNVAEFKSAMAPILEVRSQLILDLSRMRFVDSSGLGAILSCLRQLRAKGGDLKLCGMTKQVRAVFELVRMHRIFDIYATQQEAVQSLTGSMTPALRD